MTVILELLNPEPDKLFFFEFVENEKLRISEKKVARLIKIFPKLHLSFNTYDAR